MERVFYSLLISYSVPFLVIIAIGVFLNQPILRGRFHAWLAGKEGPELIYLKTISEAWAYFEFYFVWLTAFIAITVGISY